LSAFKEKEDANPEWQCLFSPGFPSGCPASFH